MPAIVPGSRDFVGEAIRAGIERDDAKRKAIALMVDALEAACRGECDVSIRKQQDALAAAVAAGLTSSTFHVRTEPS